MNVRHGNPARLFSDRHDLRPPDVGEQKPGLNPVLQIDGPTLLVCVPMCMFSDRSQFNSTINLLMALV